MHSKKAHYANWVATLLPSMCLPRALPMLLVPVAFMENPLLRHRFDQRRLDMHRSACTQHARTRLLVTFARALSFVLPASQTPLAAAYGVAWAAGLV